MTSPQEGRYTKIAAIAAVIGLVIAFLAWVHPFSPHSDASVVKTGETTTTSEPPAQPTPEPKPLESPLHTQSPDESPPADSRKPLHTDQPSPAKPTPDCGTPEIVSLRPGAPARVASGLAVLSVRTAREGSEPYLTLGITSDRDALAEAVLGAPARFRFKTRQGTYFVNVAEADLAAGTMTVQVGCEAEGNTP